MEFSFHTLGLSAATLSYLSVFLSTRNFLVSSRSFPTVSHLFPAKRSLYALFIVLSRDREKEGLRTDISLLTGAGEKPVCGGAVRYVSFFVWVATPSHISVTCFVVHEEIYQHVVRVISSNRYCVTKALLDCKEAVRAMM